MTAAAMLPCDQCKRCTIRSPYLSPDSSRAEDVLMLCRTCLETRAPLYKIAREVTDEVMGQGTYAHVNGLAPNLTIEEEP